MCAELWAPATLILRLAVDPGEPFLIMRAAFVDDLFRGESSVSICTCTCISS